MNESDLIESLRIDLDRVNGDMTRSHAAAMTAPTPADRARWMGIYQ